MDYIIPVLILFILLNSILKVSFRPLWQVAIYALVAGAFVLFIVPFAARQSKTEIVGWLNTPQVMQNVAVLITLETVVFFAFAFMRLRRSPKVSMKRYLWLPLEYYPGLLLFPTLLYMLTQLYFTLPGTDFEMVAYMLAGGVFIFLMLSVWGLQKLLPDESLRLEFLFVVNLFVCIIGLITTVNGEVTYAAVEQPINVKALLLAFSIFIMLFGCGYFINKYKKRKI